jgi:hypothetical protein
MRFSVAAGDNGMLTRDGSGNQKNAARLDVQHDANG